MAEVSGDHLAERVLVLAPTARDATATSRILLGAGIQSTVCARLEELCEEVPRGAGAAIVTEEMLLSDHAGCVKTLLAAQPAWSDLPLIVLAPAGPDSPRRLPALREVGHTILLKRPVQPSTLVSTLAGALRDRRRQYQVRDHLAERDRQADLLRESLRREERLKAEIVRLLESITDGFLAVDRSWRITYVNAAAERVYGGARRSYFGLNFWEAFPGTHQSQFGEVYRQVMRDRVPARFEGYFEPLDSWFDVNVYPVEEGGLTLYLRNVTESVRAREALKASEQRFRALGTASANVIYQMSPDWSEMQPLDGRGFVSSNAGPIRDWMARNLPQFEHKRVREAIEQAIAGKKMFELEHQVFREDGTLGWTYSRAVPILDAQGEIVEWFGAATDVTRTKQTEEDLARVREESDRRRRLYETVLANTPDLVYVFDLDHRFTYANDMLLRMWGMTWEQAIGKNCLELGYEPWHAELHDREIEQVKATKRPIRGEVPFAGTFGRRIYDYIFTPVLGPDGEVEAIAGTTRDVTDRKVAEEEQARLNQSLQEANRRKDEFLATLAHELRNPLAPIRTGLTVLRQRGSLEADGEKLLEIMERQLGYLIHLVDDLLDVSRVTTGKITLRTEPVDLSDIVSAAVETCRPGIEASRHTLTVSLPAAPLPIDGDKTRLAQVLTNLLTNAAKYTPEGGQIGLMAEQESEAVVVRVEDSGVGIPREMLPKVFEVFTQVGRSLDRSQGGLGLGLALVRKLVEMHGGSVWAESAGPGAGSTFLVRLPLATNRPATDGAPVPKNGSLRTNGQTRRILVVDDNRDAANMLSMLLKLAGHAAISAYDGRQALETAREFAPDIVFLDIGLPGMNGYEVAAHFRSDPMLARTVLVALTGWGTDDDRARSKAAGFDHHLTKPVGPEQVEEILGGFRASVLADGS